MVFDTSLQEETRRFFDGAKGGLSALSRDRLTALEQEVPRFFEGARQGLAVLGPVVAELDRHLARRFSVFNFDRLHRPGIARYFHFDENRMSDVLADLLQPNSVHGQGDLFLSALLKDLRKDEATQSGVSRLGLLLDGASWSQVRVVREAYTTHIEAWNRQIDIEISMRVGENPDRVAIAIENKPPSAPDQPNQLNDYAKHLEGKYDGRYLLLYLTPGGTEPTEGSLPAPRRDELRCQGHFACVSMVEWVNGWLQEAENQVKAAYVQRFVADFRQAVLQKYTDAESEPGSVTFPGQVAS